MSDDWALECFYHTIINAIDIDESVRFYQDLGFEIARDRCRMTWPTGGGVVFGLIPDTRAGVEPSWPSPPIHLPMDPCSTSSSG